MGQGQAEGWWGSRCWARGGEAATVGGGAGAAELEVSWAASAVVDGAAARVMERMP